MKPFPNTTRADLRIALVNPRVESFSSTLPPLGLLYIASTLERNGYRPRIFDLYPYDDSEIEELIAYKPRLIGLTVLTNYWNRAQQVATICNERLPDSTLIVGGVHVTSLPEESLKLLKADIAAIGEGEETMLELCNFLCGEENVSALTEIDGLAFYDEAGELQKTGSRNYIENLDEIPSPARHLLDFEKYLCPPGIIRGHWSERSTTIMSSRGCPYQCIWCGSQTTFGRKVRYRSVDNVIAEVEELIRDYNIDTIWFVDDTFTINKKRVIEFCEKLIERQIKISWGCQAHVKTADANLFKLMKESGCVQLDFGVESGSDEVLKAIKKGANADSVRRAFELAREANLRTAATFIFGSPTEKEEDVEATFKLAREINPNFTSSFFLTPYPGTELMDLVEANNWKLHKDSSKTGLKKMPALQVHFTEKELLKIRQRFQSAFALRNLSSLLLSPSYMFKAARLVLSHPIGIIKGLKKYFQTFVIDDLIFEFLIYYTQSKMRQQN